MRKIPNINIHIFKQPNLPWAQHSVESETVFDRMTGLTGSEKGAMNKFINSQVDSGNWAKILASGEFGHFGLQTPGNALTGWIDKTLAPINSPTHIPGTGFDFDGSTEYIEENFLPSVESSQDDVLFGVFVHTNDDLARASNREPMATFDGTRFTTILANTTTLVRTVLNAASTGIQDTTADLTSDTLFIVSRVTNARNEFYIDGVIQTSAPSRASLGLPTTEFFIGARNNNGTASSHFDGKLSSYVNSVGIGFDHADFNTNLRILNTDLAAI